MDTYIVQVYRRGPRGELHGIVERVGAEARAAFASVDELWGLLSVRSDVEGKRMPRESSKLKSHTEKRRQ